MNHKLFPTVLILLDILAKIRLLGQRGNCNFDVQKQQKSHMQK